MKTKLTQKLIIETAFKLLDSGGLENVTTRRLANELNVQSPALYWHFKNKQELLMAMRETLIESCLNSLKPYTSWQEWLLDIAINTRIVLLQYTDASTILAIAPFTERAKKELIPALYTPLISDDIDEELAKEIMAILSGFTMGWIVYEQNEAISNYITDIMNMEQSYLAGVSTIISGLELRIYKQNQNHSSLKSA